MRVGLQGDFSRKEAFTFRRRERTSPLNPLFEEGTMKVGLQSDFSRKEALRVAIWVNFLKMRFCREKKYSLKKRGF